MGSRADDAHDRPAHGRRGLRGRRRRVADEDAKLLDEIGDLLFQSCFLALLLQERGAGRPRAGDPAGAREARRPPSTRVRRARRHGAGASARAGSELKREHEGREGIFHDVPSNLPALLYARKLQRRATAVGFEYPDLAGALADLEDELAELRAELPGASRSRARAAGARRLRARRRPVRARQRRAPAERRPRARATRCGGAVPRPGELADRIAAADGRTGRRSRSPSRTPTTTERRRQGV